MQQNVSIHLVNIFPRVVSSIQIPMLHPESPYGSSCLATSFLQQNPSLSDNLLADFDNDLSQVTAILEPVFHAAERCELTNAYIQAVSTGRTAFLATNLAAQEKETVQAITSHGFSWSIGRSSNCVISIPEKTISRCHAVIGYHPEDGFYIMDVGSNNGTWLNRRPLNLMERYLLQDGDLVELGRFKVEFFVVCRNDTLSPAASDLTRY